MYRRENLPEAERFSQQLEYFMCSLMGMNYRPKWSGVVSFVLRNVGIVGFKNHWRWTLSFSLFAFNVYDVDEVRIDSM